MAYNFFKIYLIHDTECILPMCIYFVSKRGVEIFLRSLKQPQSPKYKGKELRNVLGEGSAASSEPFSWVMLREPLE